MKTVILFVETENEEQLLSSIMSDSRLIVFSQFRAFLLIAIMIVCLFSENIFSSRVDLAR